MAPTQLLESRDSFGVTRQKAWLQTIPKSLQSMVSKVGGGRHALDPMMTRFAKLRNPEIWQLIRRDATFAKAINQLLHEIAASEWFLEPVDGDEDSRALVPYLRSLIRKTPSFSTARRNLAMAVPEGLSWLKMQRRLRRMAIKPDDQVRQWTYIGWMGHISADAVRLEWDDIRRTDPETGRDYDDRDYYWATLDMPRREWLRVHPDDEWQYVRWHHNDDGTTGGLGADMLESLFFCWYFKTQCMKALLQGVDRFGWPWIVAKIGAQQHVGVYQGEGYMTPAEKGQALLAELEKQRQNGIMVLDAMDDVQIVDFRGENATGFLQLISYFDDQAISLVLGSLLPSGSNEGAGSLARANVERAQTNNLLSYYRAGEEEALQGMVDALMILNDYNFSQIQAPSGRFLNRVEIPDFRLRDSTKGLSPEAVGLMLSNGMPVIRTEAYKAFDATVPDADDDVIQPPGAGGMVPGPGGAAQDVFGNPTLGANQTIAGDGIELAESRRGGQQFRSPARGLMLTEPPAERAPEPLPVVRSSLRELVR